MNQKFKQTRSVNWVMNCNLANHQVHKPPTNWPIWWWFCLVGFAEQVLWCHNSSINHKRTQNAFKWLLSFFLAHVTMPVWWKSAQKVSELIYESHCSFWDETERYSSSTSVEVHSPSNAMNYEPLGNWKFMDGLWFWFAGPHKPETTIFPVSAHLYSWPLILRMNWFDSG